MFNESSEFISSPLNLSQSQTLSHFGEKKNGEIKIEVGINKKKCLKFALMIERKSLFHMLHPNKY